MSKPMIRRFNASTATEAAERALRGIAACGSDEYTVKIDASAGYIDVTVTMRDYSPLEAAIDAGKAV